MTERAQMELELVRARYPSTEYRDEDGWAKVPAYPIPGSWGRTEAEIAFRMPANTLVEQPYGFWVRPPLQLPDGAPPGNSNGPVDTGFGQGWQQFSWAPADWRPHEDVRRGSHMLDFVRSFADRLAEVS